ncbi:MAG: c-type cytochrome [Chitinophagaceae bacterium]|nr:c-type cytochrome [Chitinophagaceae bacterium]
MSNRSIIRYVIVVLLVTITGGIILYKNLPDVGKYPSTGDGSVYWDPPSWYQMPETTEGKMILYGRELVINTARFLGPKGSVAAISNGMNCQNCHPEAGTRLNANCFALVASTYPKFRERSGRLESVEFRVNECFERSLNGKRLDSQSREMRAFVAYLNWLGKDVVKGQKLKGMSIPELPLMDRAASVSNGASLYQSKCVQCHGLQGAGLPTPDGTDYIYPPLWGPNSYNVSAGLYRLTRTAGFIKYNMPYTPVQQAPQLTDEEAWDLAAFINSQPRPEKFFEGDWPMIASKPFDHPFGPFADTFPAVQHKYGPFKMIKAAKKK